MREVSSMSSQAVDVRFGVETSGDRVIEKRKFQLHRDAPLAKPVGRVGIAQRRGPCAGAANHGAERGDLP